MSAWDHMSQVEPSLAVTCVPKAQYLLVSCQCQWSGVLGKVPSNRVQELSSWDAVSRMSNHQAPNCDHQDSMTWDPGKLL